MKVFSEGKEWRGRPNSWIKQPNSFKEKLDTKKETRRESSHIVSKPSPERVTKSCLKCLKLETPEMANKKNLCLVCQVTPSSSQVVEKYKTLLWKEAGMIIIFGWMPKIYFFQLPKLNKYWLGGWTSSCIPGDKKAQNGSFAGLHAVSHFVPQQLKNVIKNQKGHASFWNSEYMYSTEK